MGTATVYTLAPNGDGTQHTNYPAGGLPIDSLDAPGNYAVQSVTVDSITVAWSYDDTGHTGFEHQQYISGVSSSWETVDVGLATDRSYVATGLPGGVYVGHRSRATSATSASAWSTEAWQTTDTAPSEPGVGLIFQDNFSSYAVGEAIASKTPPVAAPGARWTWTGGSDVVVGVGGRSGNCLHFNWVASSDNTDGTTDPLRSRCEQNLRLCDSAASAKQEVWMEFYLNISGAERSSANFTNDKFVSMLNQNYSNGGHSTYGRLANIFNTWGSDNDRYATFSPAQYNQDGSSQTNFGHNHEAGGIPPYGPGYLGNKQTWYYNWATSANYNHEGTILDAIQQADAGQWIRHRVYIKINDLAVANGAMKWWRNNDVILDVDQIYQDFLDGYNKIDGMYLMGSFNAGFLDANTWKLDDISIWDTDPGWSFS